ncbi:MAG: acetylornithine/succinylornithine family transaminase [Acidimicrobiia bacterium]|nr:acetylornithine/succinylornithine family transaminase [Acidimicrobiia bacterium]
MSNVVSLEAQHVLPTYKRHPVVFVRGEGTRLFDENGKRYLDFLSGIGVCVLGHAHPGLAAVIAEQSKTLIHTSNLFYHPLQGRLAAKLAAMSGLQRTFFCNSGTEAVEACLKFARRYWYSKGIRNRTQYVALEHGFSGRTMGALSVTANAQYRDPFGPLIPGVTFIAQDDIQGLEAAVTDRTAAIIAEPIQGEGGVRPLSPAFAAAVERVTTATGTLLIADEIQCGLGRTGRPFHCQSFGWTPDLIPVGKAIGSGIPIGAALVAEHVAKEIVAGDHGTTYGGNLLSTRAALFVLDELDTLAPHVKAMGALLEQKLGALQQKHQVITAVKGAGLMQGLHLSVDALPVVEASLKAGLVVNRTAETVVRMLPPLIVGPADIEEAVGILDGALASATAGAAGTKRTAEQVNASR